MDRRTALGLLSGSLVMPNTAFAVAAREITWDDLIPAGLPYSEIIGEGELDEVNDTWNPIYDENATKLNKSLDGAYIKMPGYIIPLEGSVKGVSEFMLVQSVGRHIHKPLPPANQVVMVKTANPWPESKVWEAVWVIGTMRTQLQSTDLGQTGYALEADRMEVYVW